jgi:3-phenylpropionate/trans-cinnamate dioxygenase ferredoxin subunit
LRKKEAYIMSEFVRVCKVSDLDDPGKMVVEVGDQLVALFHVDGRFYAIDDLCTHDGGPLADGELTDHVIICPRHGAKFDIRDGRALTMPATRATASHEVKVEGEDVFVRLREQG